MGEKRKKEGENQEGAEEPPRKAPRLDQLVAAAAAMGSGHDEAVAQPEVINPREEGTEGTSPPTSDKKQCNHVPPADSAHMKMLSSSVLSERARMCELCTNKKVWSDILMCLSCARHFCSGVGSVEYPFGHSRFHAKKKKHWVAALSENPQSAFCFKCDCVVDGPHIITGLLAAAENSGSDEEYWPEPKDSGYSGPCNHIPTGSAHMERLRSSLESEPAGKCFHCKTLDGSILVCMECGRHFCAGDGSDDSPSGHSRLHAVQKQHWVAALYNEPDSAYCFKCEYVVCVADPADDVEEDGFEAGDHAFQLLRVAGNLVRGLANAFSSSSVQGYAIRGIPNKGNTCYLSALLQCFLVLDKLRARMLRPDAPNGLFAKALTELFVGTSAAGSLLDPVRLLSCVRLYNKDFRDSRMHDSHELLISLRGGLDEEEEGIKNHRHGQNGAPTIIKSIFGFKMSETRTCKCLSTSVSRPDFLDLSLTLASQIEISKSQLKKIATQLFPTNEQSKPERTQTISESGDSHLPCSELKDVVVEETPGPLEVGVWILKNKVTSNVEVKILKYVEDNSYWFHDVAIADKIKYYMLGSADPTDVQRVCQSKDVVQGPLRTLEDKVPVKSSRLLPLSMFDVKVEEMNETKANSVATIEYCLSLFLDEALKWRCDNCSKVHKELGTNESKNGEQMVANMEETTTVHGDQGEQSDRTTCKNDQSSGLDTLSIESKSSSSTQTHGSDAEGQIIQREKVIETTNLGQQSEDISIQLQKRKKLTELDHSAYQLEDNRNEQEDWDGYAIQTRRFISLPPVLTLHLRRSRIDKSKLSDHVICKEYLDVEPFMDPSSEEKGNFIYRLVGLVEHIGTKSVESGHYVAYVRARKLGNPKQQDSCSHSWFCANDEKISLVSLEDVLKREAYILFYERMEG